MTAPLQTLESPDGLAGQSLGAAPCSAAFVECTDDYEREQGGERWIRRIDPKCWISALYRRTGFGWMEWETAIVIVIEPGSRPKRWKGDDRDCLIIAGDRREELATMPKEQLRDWYAANIDGNRNSMETALHALKQQNTEASRDEGGERL